MNTRTINVRLPEALYGKLEELAKATARTKSYLAIEALSGYLETESWQIRDIRLGMQEADAEDVAIYRVKGGDVEILRIHPVAKSL